MRAVGRGSEVDRVGQPERRLVYGYLCVEGPDETRVAAWTREITTFATMSGYRLGTIFIDQGTSTGSLARSGFIELLAALRLSDAYAAVVPSLAHLSTDMFSQQALAHVVQLTDSQLLVSTVSNGCGPENELSAEPGGRSMNRIVASKADGRAIRSQTVSDVASMPSTIASVTDMPFDPTWHDNAVLVAELATLNKRISRYIASTLDADAQRGEPVRPADEAALGRTLVQLGVQLRDRSPDQSPTSVTAATYSGTSRDDYHPSEPIVPSTLSRSSQPPQSTKRAIAATEKEVSDRLELDNNLVIEVTSTPSCRTAPSSSCLTASTTGP